jgi:hypothetical protein
VTLSVDKEVADSLDASDPVLANALPRTPTLSAKYVAAWLEVLAITLVTLNTFFERKKSCILNAKLFST